jgi:hypothetical protein
MHTKFEQRHNKMRTFSGCILMWWNWTFWNSEFLTVTGLLNQHVGIYLLVTQYMPSISAPLSTLWIWHAVSPAVQTLHAHFGIYMRHKQLNSFAMVSTSQSLSVVLYVNISHSFSEIHVSCKYATVYLAFQRTSRKFISWNHFTNICFHCNSL